MLILKLEIKTRKNLQLYEEKKTQTSNSSLNQQPPPKETPLKNELFNTKIQNKIITLYLRYIKELIYFNI